MRHARMKIMGVAFVVALSAAAGLPGHASAQSQLDVAQAQAFLGKWVISMQTDFGPFSMNLDLADQGGKVAGSVGAPEMGGMQSVTDISRSGETLVLKFTSSAQGQVFDVSLALVPSGEALAVLFDVGAGQFSASGVATRAAS